MDELLNTPHIKREGFCTEVASLDATEEPTSVDVAALPLGRHFKKWIIDRGEWRYLVIIDGTVYLDGNKLKEVKNG